MLQLVEIDFMIISGSTFLSFTDNNRINTDPLFGIVNIVQ